VYVGAPFSAEDPRKDVQEFVRAFRAKFGREPNSFAALAYDATRILFDAIKRAGTTDGPKVREALAQTKDFSGVTGQISMDAHRNAVKPAVVLELMDVKFIYRETIQPQVAQVAASPTPSPQKGTKAKK